MPYADPERQKRYYRDRAERRRNDPEYISARNARQRERYAGDPEFRERYAAYQGRWRREKRTADPEWRDRSLLAARAQGRRWRGLRWSEDEQAAFEALLACEVCGADGKKLRADHCHDCGAYRGGLCDSCNTAEGHLRKWGAACPEGSPMRVYMDRHACEAAA